MTFIKKNSYLMTVIVLCIVFTAFGLHKMEQEAAYQQLVVTEGDTLWAYSLQYANNMSQEQWIKKVTKLNGLPSTTIKVGDELKIPVIAPDLDRGQIATNVAGDEN